MGVERLPPPSQAEGVVTRKRTVDGPTWGYIALYVLCGAVVLFNSALVPVSIAVGRWDLVIQNLMSALVPLGLLVVVEMGRRSLD